MHKLNLIDIPVRFDESNHTYINTLNGDLLTGVTTIISVRSREFLKWWAAKEVVKYLTDKQEIISKATPEEYIKLLDEAKFAHTRKSKEALVSGAIAHDWIEKYLKAKIEETEFNKEQFTEDEKANSAIKAFLDWESKHIINWLASELIVASLKHKYAGTVDWVAKVDGILTLGDFKTSNQISEEVAIQVAGYTLALDEMLKEGEERPKQRMVLRIPKDGSEFECQRIDTDLEFDKEVFIHLRETHRWNLFINNHFKDENGRIQLQINEQNQQGLAK